MYKKILFSFFIYSLFSCFESFAQGRGDKVESIKIAYLSEKLNLDPKTAEKFWPIYNQYDDEMRRVIQESKRTNDARTAEEILDQEQKAIDIKRKYNALFSKVISGEQLSNLYQSEKEFHKILLRRMNKMENKQEPMHSNPDDRMRNRPRMNQDRPSPAGMENRPQRRGNR